MWQTQISLSINHTPIKLVRRRQWQATPVLLPGKSHGRRSLAGCSPWGRRVGHDWATSLSLFTFMHWRRKWQPTPVFLPGESQGRGSPVGCHLWVTQSRTRLKRLSSSSSSSSSVYMSIPISWFTPPPPFSLGNLFSTTMFLFVLQIISTLIFFPHIRDIIWYLTFSV